MQSDEERKRAKEAQDKLANTQQELEEVGFDALQLWIRGCRMGQGTWVPVGRRCGILLAGLESGLGIDGEGGDCATG